MMQTTLQELRKTRINWTQMSGEPQQNGQTFVQISNAKCEVVGKSDLENSANTIV